MSVDGDFVDQLLHMVGPRCRHEGAQRGDRPAVASDDDLVAGRSGSIDDAGRAESARRQSLSRAVDSPVAHIDLAHSLRFTEDGPLLVDVVTAPTDPIRGQAIAAVDLLSAKAAGEDLLWRWALSPGWSKNVVCAMSYRLSVHALHPDSTQSAFAGLRSATEIVDRYARAAHNL